MRSGDGHPVGMDVRRLIRNAGRHRADGVDVAWDVNAVVDVNVRHGVERFEPHAPTREEHPEEPNHARDERNERVPEADA